MTRKVHAPRYRLNRLRSDPPMTTFYPRTHTWFSCRALPLFCRKWRGNRSRTWRALIQRGLAPTPWAYIAVDARQGLTR